MAEYLVQDTSLTAIADKIRVLTGVTDALSLDAMETNLDDANTAVASALAALVEKEVEVPDGTNVTGLAKLIGAIESAYDVSYGTITPAEDVTSLTWEHGLSKAPSFVMIFLRTGYSFTTYDTILRGMYFVDDTSMLLSVTSKSSTSYVYYDNTISSSSTPYTIDEKTITMGQYTPNNVQDYRAFCAGKPYSWIAIEGGVVF